MISSTRIEPMLSSSQSTRITIAQRSPQRISVTLPWALYQRLLERAAHEGRSVSNLSAHLLEGAM